MDVRPGGWRPLMGLCAWGLGLLGVTGCGVATQGQNASGVQLYQQAQYESAAQYFQQALTTDPNNADAYYNLASTYRQLGLREKDSSKLSQAEMLYNQCLDRNENHVDCRRALAVLLVETGRQDKAFTMLNNWVFSVPAKELV